MSPTLIPKLAFVIPEPPKAALPPAVTVQTLTELTSAPGEYLRNREAPGYA